MTNLVPAISTTLTSTADSHTETIQTTLSVGLVQEVRPGPAGATVPAFYIDLIVKRTNYDKFLFSIGNCTNFLQAKLKI